MDRNSFNFMKQGFDWQSAQSKDMKEIRNDAIYEEERERRAGIFLVLLAPPQREEHGQEHRRDEHRGERVPVVGDG